MKGKNEGFARNPLYYNVKIGPYETQEEALAALKKYCVEELGSNFI